MASITNAELIEGAVFGLQLAEDLFTVAQLRENTLMQCFSVRAAKPNFEGLDLGTVPVLFTVFANPKRFKPLITGALGPEIVTPNTRPVPRLMLSPIIEPGPRYGADLVQLGDDLSAVTAAVVQADLTIADDLAALHTHELTGMIGDPTKLQARLLAWFQDGLNWDPAKEVLYPEITPPPAGFLPAD